MQKKDVKAILKDLAAGALTQKEIGVKFGCSRSLVSDIATGRAHTDIERPEGITRPSGGQSDDLELRLLKMSSQLEHARSERNMRARQVRAAVLSDGLFTAVADEMRSVIKPFRKPKSLVVPKVRDTVEEHAVLLISDLHLDQIVQPEAVGGLERFNFGIGTRRMEVLAESVIRFLTKTLKGYHFPVLHVLCLGDNLSSPIHNHTTRSAFRNDFVNSMAVGQVITSAISEFSQHFKKVNTLFLSGNHPRRSPTKAYPFPLDNFDYLVAESVRLMCGNLTNVEFNIPNSFTATVPVNGKNIFACHGDDLRGSHPIEALKGLYRKLSQLGMPIDACVCGHFHQSGSFAGPATSFEGPPVEFISNGALIGTDEFAFNALTASGVPSQMLFGVHATRGLTWRLPIQVRTPDEADGARRYKISTVEPAYE